MRGTDLPKDVAGHLQVVRLRQAGPYTDPPRESRHRVKGGAIDADFSFDAGPADWPVRRKGQATSTANDGAPSRGDP